MFYSGLDPETLEPVPCARTAKEKKMMKALVFYWDKEHWPLAREALKLAGRSDLIGRAPHCLVPPDYGATASETARKSKSRSSRVKGPTLDGGERSVTQKRSSNHNRSVSKSRPLDQNRLATQKRDDSRTQGNGERRARSFTRPHQ